MAGRLTDEEYSQEFQTLIEMHTEEVYEEQDPLMFVYRELARMVVLCTRLYIGLRAAEARVEEMLGE